MKTAILIFFVSISLLANSQVPAKVNGYDGSFCKGIGDTDFLRLIDESFAFFNPNPAVPNLTMVYKPEWDTFTEGAGWGAWWIQNSYGFSYAATPFLQEPWFSILQQSWDLFWENQGDGKRKGMLEMTRRALPFRSGRPRWLPWRFCSSRANSLQAG